MQIETWGELIAIYILPLVLIVLYLFFNLQFLDKWMSKSIPSYYGRVYVKGLIFTLILYIIMLIILNVWHENNCDISEEIEEIQEVLYPSDTPS